MTSPAARTLAQPCQHRPGRGAAQLRREWLAKQPTPAGLAFPAARTAQVDTVRRRAACRRAQGELLATTDAQHRG